MKVKKKKAKVFSFINNIKNSNKNFKGVNLKPNMWGKIQNKVLKNDKKKKKKIQKEVKPSAWAVRNE